MYYDPVATCRIVKYKKVLQKKISMQKDKAVNLK